MIQPFGNLGHPRLGIFLNRSSQYPLPRVPFALTPGVGNTAKALSERNHSRWAGRAALVKRNGSGGQLHGCGQQRSALSPWLLVLPAVLARPCLLCPVPPRPRSPRVQRCWRQAPAAFLLPSSAPSAPSPSLPGQRRVQGSPERSPRPDSLTLPRIGREGCLAPGPLQMPLPAAGSRSPA